MRQGFTIELSEDEEVQFSTVKDSNKVRINADDKDGDAVEIEVSLKDAKAMRDALNKAIDLAENPFSVTIDASKIKVDSIYGRPLSDYYFYGNGYNPFRDTSFTRYGYR